MQFTTTGIAFLYFLTHIILLSSYPPLSFSYSLPYSYIFLITFLHYIILPFPSLFPSVTSPFLFPCLHILHHFPSVHHNISLLPQPLPSPSTYCTAFSLLLSSLPKLHIFLLTFLHSIIPPFPSPSLPSVTVVARTWTNTGGGAQLYHLE